MATLLIDCFADKCDRDHNLIALMVETDTIKRLCSLSSMFHMMREADKTVYELVAKPSDVKGYLLRYEDEDGDLDYDTPLDAVGTEWLDKSEHFGANLNFDRISQFNFETHINRFGVHFEWKRYEGDDEYAYWTDPIQLTDLTRHAQAA